FPRSANSASFPLASARVLLLEASRHRIAPIGRTPQQAAKCLQELPTIEKSTFSLSAPYWRMICVTARCARNSERPAVNRLFQQTLLCERKFPATATRRSIFRLPRTLRFCSQQHRNRRRSIVVLFNR